MNIGSVLLLVLVMVAGCAARSSEPPAVVTGTGTIASERFQLIGGAYRMTVSTTADDPTCIAMAELQPVAAGSPHMLAPILDHGYSLDVIVPPGGYYVQTYATCDWTATVAPR